MITLNDYLFSGDTVLNILLQYSADGAYGFSHFPVPEDQGIGFHFLHMNSRKR